MFYKNNVFQTNIYCMCLKKDYCSCLVHDTFRVNNYKFCRNVCTIAYYIICPIGNVYLICRVFLSTHIRQLTLRWIIFKQTCKLINSLRISSNLTLFKFFRCNFRDKLPLHVNHRLHILSFLLQMFLNRLLQSGKITHTHTHKPSQWHFRHSKGASWKLGA